jgi:hypothetical protein
MTTEKPPRPPRHEWKAAFLEAFRNSGNVRAACQAAAISRKTAYAERLKSKAFEKQWDEAREEAIDTLEAAAWSRARTTSDYLLWKLLQSNRRSLYGDKMEVTVTSEEKATVIARMMNIPLEEARAAVAEAEAVLRGTR